MVDSFIKIKTRAESMYVSVNDINKIENDIGGVILKTHNDTIYDVIEINNVPCESIDDAAHELNLFDIQ